MALKKVYKYNLTIFGIITMTKEVNDHDQHLKKKSFFNFKSLFFHFLQDYILLRYITPMKNFKKFLFTSLKRLFSHIIVVYEIN